MKTIKDIFDKDNIITDNISNIADSGIFESSKIDFLKRTFDLNRTTPIVNAEKRLVLELLNSLIDGYCQLQENKNNDGYLSKVDARGSNGSTDKDIPSVIILKRKAIRVYPDHQKVALYYSQLLDKYITIPFGIGGNDVGAISMNEDADIDVESAQIMNESSIRQSRVNPRYVGVNKTGFIKPSDRRDIRSIERDIRSVKSDNTISDAEKAARIAEIKNRLSDKLKSSPLSTKTSKVDLYTINNVASLRKPHYKMAQKAIIKDPDLSVAAKAGTITGLSARRQTNAAANLIKRIALQSNIANRKSIPNNQQSQSQSQSQSTPTNTNINTMPTDSAKVMNNNEMDIIKKKFNLAVSKKLLETYRSKQNQINEVAPIIAGAAAAAARVLPYVPRAIQAIRAGTTATRTGVAAGTLGSSIASSNAIRAGASIGGAMVTQKLLNPSNTNTQTDDPSGEPKPVDLQKSSVDNNTNKPVLSQQKQTSNDEDQKDGQNSIKSKTSDNIPTLSSISPVTATAAATAASQAAISLGSARTATTPAPATASVPAAAQQIASAPSSSTPAINKPITGNAPALGTNTNTPIQSKPMTSSAATSRTVPERLNGNTPRRPLPVQPQTPNISSPDKRLLNPGQFKLQAHISKPVANPRTGVVARDEALFRRQMQPQYNQPQLREDTVFDKVKKIAESDSSISSIIQIKENTININSYMANKIISAYNSLNKTNKNEMQKMLNESVDSFKKVLTFSIKKGTKKV